MLGYGKFIIWVDFLKCEMMYKNFVNTNKSDNLMKKNHENIIKQN